MEDEEEEEPDVDDMGNWHINAEGQKGAARRDRKPGHVRCRTVMHGQDSQLPSTSKHRSHLNQM